MPFHCTDAPDGYNDTVNSRGFVGLNEQQPTFPATTNNNTIQQGIEGLNRTTRQAATGCSFVEATCTANPSCGLMPLYNFLGDKTPNFGKGVFPWQV